MAKHELFIVTKIFMLTLKKKVALFYWQILQLHLGGGNEKRNYRNEGG